jgi:hypothetical protein
MTNLTLKFNFMRETDFRLHWRVLGAGFRRFHRETQRTLPLPLGCE